MPTDNGCERSEQVVSSVRDGIIAEIARPGSSALLWPWSYRIGGALSSSPAVEIYEDGLLVDVVSSTTLDVPVLRHARRFRVSDGRHVAAWGRLPRPPSVPVVEFSGGRLRVSRQCVVPVSLTSWCWLAVTSGRYDAVTVWHDRTAVRQRVRGGHPCP